ncbi:type II toxin-antitoxin system HicB family antitoxin [Candidatus Woesebacteria bacterium]|nr:type II toxin-antitoxin system HicB family antitoxin [Candidatus Woesebacteria bacterium]
MEVILWVPALPGCTSQGDTFEEAIDNIKEAVGLYLQDDTKSKYPDRLKDEVIYSGDMLNISLCN